MPADVERTDGTGLNLRGQTLIVTGASKGVGRALASELARNGVNLVLNARSEVSLEEAAADARKSGVRALTVVGDAALADNAGEMVKAAVGMGEFIGFIHNAGTNHPGPFLYELPDVLFEDVWRSNVLAGYRLAYFYPELRRMGRGLAVFFGSGAAESNIEGIGVYSLSKAAEEHMARQRMPDSPQERLELRRIAICRFTLDNREACLKESVCSAHNMRSP